MTSHQNITSQEPTSCSAGIHGVAIVGIACRFPGSENVEEFWESLKRGENHVTEIPKERWSQTAYYDPETDRPGTTYTNKAALLDRYIFNSIKLLHRKFQLIIEGFFSRTGTIMSVNIGS